MQFSLTWIYLFGTEIHTRTRMAVYTQGNENTPRQLLAQRRANSHVKSLLAVQAEPG